MSGNTFTWKSGAGLRKSGIADIGVIAQEVNGVLPDITREVNGVMSVRYEKLIPLLIECVKEFKDFGATILGGCCETTPAHIRSFASLK